MIRSRISKAVTKSNAGTLCHLVLSDTEHVEGLKLGIDSWAAVTVDMHLWKNLLNLKLLQLRDLHHP